MIGLSGNGLESIISNFGQQTNDAYTQMESDARGDLNNPTVQAQLQLSSTLYSTDLRLKSEFISMLRTLDSEIIQKMM